MFHTSIQETCAPKDKPSGDLLVYCANPVHFHSGLLAVATAKTVLDAQHAQQERINQDPGYPLVPNVRREPFLLQLLPCLA